MGGEAGGETHVVCKKAGVRKYQKEVKVTPEDGKVYKGNYKENSVRNEAKGKE